MYNKELTGKDLRVIRESFGFTLQDFSKVINCTKEYIHRLEAQDRTICDKMKINIMRSLNILNDDNFDNMIVGLRALYKETGFKTIHAKYIIAEMVVNYIEIKNNKN